MFLLIRVSPETLICLVAFFKFHYVSINSFPQLRFHNRLLLPLNSIMFLLIHDEDEEERKEFEQL